MRPRLMGGFALDSPRSTCTAVRGLHPSAGEIDVERCSWGIEKFLILLRYLPMRLAPLILLLLVGVGGASRDAETLSAQQMAQAVEMGSNCEAPIIKIAGPGDYDIYVETPLARVALVAATAKMMQQSLDGQNVRTAMRPVYRVWLDRTRDRWQRFSLNTMTIWSRGVEIHPSAVRNARLFLGTVPSHGIIEPLRTRRPEFLFDSLPAGGFEVVVHGNDGEQRLSVGKLQSARPMRVCN